ncbi:MAG TPA: Dabb family protein [Caldithrix abyssi]|uniref:Dabb family protein n=1 Tax=Caldithrix abyssi TaxID=187145 RepID=A0A7V4WW56_CALAY|nr:Dabb family protein [Caldithrix abyssi]
MIKHVVMWKLKEEAEGYSKAVNLQRMKRKIGRLEERIPLIRFYEIGIDYLHTPASYDLVLVSAFDTKEDLKAYREHPEHQAVVEEIKPLVQERVVVDYEV